jgi:RNA polymerase sigma-70 factor (ECF subfamily)
MTLLTEDRALLDGFRRGDRAALERVYDHYVDHLAAFLRGGFTFSSKGETLAFKGYRSPADLQDMLQETFCRAFSPRARQAYDGIHPFKSYLLTIARNLTIDRFRRQVREVFEPVDGGGPGDRLDGGGPGLDGEPAGPPSPERELLDREVAEIVRGFYAELDARDRRVLRVYFEGDEGQRAAAAELEMTRHQLRKAIGRIRKRLQVRLIKGGYLSRDGREGRERRKSAMLLLVALVLR